MAKKLPGFHRFPGFPKPRNSRNPETNYFIDYLFNHRWTLSISFHKIGHGLPSFPVSWFLLISKGCPGGETRGNWNAKVLMPCPRLRNKRKHLMPICEQFVLWFLSGMSQCISLRVLPKLAVMDVFKNGCVQKLGQPCNEIIADMFKFDIDVLVSVTCSVFSIFATHFWIEFSD